MSEIERPGTQSDERDNLTRPNAAAGGLLVPTLAFSLFLLAAVAAGLLLAVGLRSYALIAGWTASAGVVAVAAMALGAAAGGTLAGRRAERSASPAGALGALMAGLGLAALVAPLLLRLARFLYLVLWPLVGATGPGAFCLRLLPALALFTPAAALFLAMPAHLERLIAAGRRGRGAAAGFAIGLTLAGLAFGLLIGGLGALPALGLRGAWLLGLALAGLAASGMVLLRQGGFEGRGVLGARLAGGEPAMAAADEDAPVEEIAAAGVINGAVVLLGFALWSFFIAWSRTLQMIAGGSSATRAITAAVILACLAGGVILAAGLADRMRSPCLVLCGLLSVGVLIAYGSTFLVPLAGTLFLRLSPWLSSPGPAFAATALTAIAVVLPASVVLGAALPFIPLAAGARRRPVIGTIAFLALGVFLAELIVTLTVVPAFGLRRTVSLAAGVGLIAAILYIVASNVCRAAQRNTISLVLLSLVLVVGGFPAQWDPRVVISGLYRQGSEVLEAFGSSADYLDARRRVEVAFYREGSEATVMVERTFQPSPGQSPAEVLALTLDGDLAAGTGQDIRTQVLVGQLPMLVHGPGDKALLVGFMSGVTAGSMLRHPLQTLVVIEREPALYLAAEGFADYSGSPQNDDRLRRVGDDGRARLLADQTLYDVIVVASVDPWLPEDAALCTREGYDLLRSRLKAGGLVAQRLPLGAASGPALRSILRTFGDSFASVLLFQVSPDDLLVVGSDRELDLDVGWLRNILGSNSGVTADLQRVHLLGVNEIVMSFRLGGEALRRLVSEAPVNGDDRAAVEYAAARRPGPHRNAGLVQAIDQAWSGITPILKNYGALPRERAEFLYDLAKSYLGVVGDPVRALDLARELSGTGQAAMARWVRGEALLQQADIDGALEEWRAVLDLEPANIDALFSIGTYYLDARDFWEAEKYLARAARAAPGTAAVRYHYGRALFYLGRYRETVDQLQKTRDLGGDRFTYPVIDYLVGVASLKLGRAQPAAEALKSYLDWAYRQTTLTLLEVDAHLKLGDAYEQIGKRFDAHRERQKAEELRQKIQASAAARRSPATEPSAQPAPEPSVQPATEPSAQPAPEAPAQSPQP